MKRLIKFLSIISMFCFGSLAFNSTSAVHPTTLNTSPATQRYNTPIRFDTAQHHTAQINEAQQPEFAPAYRHRPTSALAYLYIPHTPPTIQPHTTQPQQQQQQEDQKQSQDEIEINPYETWKLKNLQENKEYSQLIADLAKQFPQSFDSTLVKHYIQEHNANARQFLRDTNNINNNG